MRRLILIISVIIILSTTGFFIQVHTDNSIIDNFNFNSFCLGMKISINHMDNNNKYVLIKNREDYIRYITTHLHTYESRKAFNCGFWSSIYFIHPLNDSKPNLYEFYKACMNNDSLKLANYINDEANPFTMEVVQSLIKEEDWYYNVE